MAMSAPGADEPRHRARWRRRDHQQRPHGAEADRADTEAARRQAELAQQRAEAHRAAAESTAFAVAKERDDALQRVAALEEQLSAVLAQEPDEPTQPEPEPEARRPELVEFGTKGGRAALTVLLGLASLIAAAFAVYLAVLDQLVTVPGLAASGVSLLMALAVRHAGRSTTHVSIRHGTVTIARPDGLVRLDLTSPATLVDVLGAAGTRDRRVLFVRRTKAPLKVDRSMVDVDAFVDTIRLWRPEL